MQRALHYTFFKQIKTVHLVQMVSQIEKLNVLAVKETTSFSPNYIRFFRQFSLDYATNVPAVGELKEFLMGHCQGLCKLENLQHKSTTSHSKFIELINSYNN